MQRRAARFRLCCPIEFRFRGPRGLALGRGVTVDLGSHGILFESSAPVKPGSRMEAVVALSAKAGGPPLALLHVQGIAVRCDNGKVAVAVKKQRLRRLNRT